MSTKPDLSTLTFSTAMAGLRRRDFSAIDLAEDCFHRIERLNPLINAFITPTIELALETAIQADLILANPPSDINELKLLGIPLGIKDLFDLARVPTTGGSKFKADSLPDVDATVVSKLKLSGGVILGKTNTHEFALGVTGVNPHFGAVKNPWDFTRIAGGSSSGSAAAVASGMCLAALGTDTGGSIRIPASLCGVVGLKPTYARVSTHGVIPLSWNLDHVGPLTRTVRDSALMLSVLAGYDEDDPVSADVPVDDYLVYLENGVKDWRIALATGDFIQSADPEVLAAIDDAALVFTELGAWIDRVDTSWLQDLAKANGQMTQADAAAFHRRRLAEHPDWFGQDVLMRLRSGEALSSSDYALARRIQAEGRRFIELFFKDYDILMLPTTPVSAPTIEGTRAVEAAGQLTSFTAPFDLTGVPALSLPCGFSQTGMPIGLQIVSKHWAEAKVLQAGYAFEEATDWHLQFPKL